MSNGKHEFSRYEIYYREFPELLFTTRSDGAVYFDATSYIKNKGDPAVHTLEGFREMFACWIDAVGRAYAISGEEAFIAAPNGHLLIDNALALLFVAYVDPCFMVYMTERIADMLRQGVVLSDTCLLAMAKDRLTKDQL